MTKKQRNGKIEFLRFYFAVLILLFHIGKRFFGTPGADADPFRLYFFDEGLIGVEFFFLVSGYFLAAHIYKMRDQSTKYLGQETANMIKAKFFHIFPYHFYAMAITVVINAILLYDVTDKKIKYVLDSWSSLFFLEVFGFESSWANKLTWYLAVWLMVMFILYPIGRKNYDVFMNIICPLLALFVLGYLDYTTQSLSDIEDWTGLFYKCFLRGFAEMALGCLAFSLVRWMNDRKWTVRGKKFLTFVEIFGYLFVLFYTCTRYNGQYEFLMLFVIFGLVILSFSDIAPGVKYFNKPWAYKLGKLSLVIYLNQFYCIRLVEYAIPDAAFYLQCIACIALTFLASILADTIITWLTIHKPIKSFFIQKES